MDVDGSTVTSPHVDHSDTCTNIYTNIHVCFYKYLCISYVYKYKYILIYIYIYICNYIYCVYIYSFE